MNQPVNHHVDGSICTRANMALTKPPSVSIMIHTPKRCIHKYYAVTETKVSLVHPLTLSISVVIFTILHLLVPSI